MSEQDPIIDQEQKSSNLPVFLVILLVLTSLNIAYNVYTSISNLGAEETIQEIQQQLYENLENSGTNMDELPPMILSAFEDFFPRFVNNYSAFAWFELGYYLLLILPVILMFKTRKIGFYLYALLQLVGSFSFLYFFGANWISISISLFLLLGAIIWIVLYWLNRKHLH